MANTNSTIFEISNQITSFPFPTLKTGTIETVGNDVIGSNTLFFGIDAAAVITLGGTVDDMNSISVAYQTGGPNSSVLTNLIGSPVTAAVDLTTMASDIATAISSYPSSPKFNAVSSGDSIYVYPENGVNAVGMTLTAVPNGTMTSFVLPFQGGIQIPNINTPELRGQQWIWNPITAEIAKVDFVRDNVSAHIVYPFLADMPAGSSFYTIEENHWHAINFLNIGTASGYIDGVEIPQGVSVSFNKANQDGFGTFNMIDPKVVDASNAGCKFLVTVY